MTVTSGQFQASLRKVDFPMQKPLDTILSSTSNRKTAVNANLQMQSVKQGPTAVMGWSAKSQLINQV